MPVPTRRALPADRLSGPLPKRFPVGARYVVEGRGGENGHLRVISRYVVLPGGRRINVPAEMGPKAKATTGAKATVGARGGRRGRSGAAPTGSRAKKYFERPGTAEHRPH
jgi:hypothetical protein